MEKRIYIATKANTSVGVIFDVTANKAQKLTHVHNAEKTGSAGVRVVALSAVVEQLKTVNFEELTVPLSVFVIPTLKDFIANETYKFWIASGKMSSGEAVDADELGLWEEFAELYGENHSLIAIRDIFKARIPKNNKFKVDKTRKQNDYYADYSWKEIEKLNLTDMPEVADVAE